MNLVWHIVKKDFTRLRLPLLLWTCLLLGAIVVAARMFSAESIDGQWFNQQMTYQGVLYLTWLVVCFILIAALGLEDTLVGTKMFWVTRPISGGRLLAAKLLGAAVFFVLGPVLVSGPWWFWCGFGLVDAGYGALQIMMLQALLVLPALALAALAGESSRFLLWALLALLVVPSGTGLVGYYLPKDLSRDVIASRLILAYAVGFVTAGAVIWLQYRSRRLVRSVIVTVAGVALAVLIGFVWPWDVTGLWPKDTSQLAGTEQISVTLGKTTLRTKDGKSWVTLRFTAKDIPPEIAILSGRAWMEFRWPDGTTLLRRGQVGPVNPDYSARSLLNLPPAQTDPATAAKRAEMAEAYRQRMSERGLSPARPQPEGFSLITSVDIPIELAAKFASPPAVHVALRLQTGRPELLVEIPLTEGAGRAANGVRLHLLKLETVEPAARDEPATQVSATVITTQPLRMKFVQFLLVDRVHGDVIMEGASFTRANVLPLGITRSQLRLNIPQIWRDDRWIGMPEWLEQDTLAAVTFRPNGGFDRTLQVDRLEVVPTISRAARK